MCGRFGVTDREMDLISHENAMRWYQFDPFAIRPREQCTVGTLRAEAEGHDVSVRTFDAGRFEREQISLGELQDRATA
jgi:hypothetical protein